MYTFVFMWTPALKTVEETNAEVAGETLDESTAEFLGIIFATFMVSVMVGSSVFNIAGTSKDNVYSIPLYLHAMAFCTMAIISLFMSNKFIVYVMFLVFEMSVGLFYPAYGMIKSEKIPEDIRSAVMNIFRWVISVPCCRLSQQLTFCVLATQNSPELFCCHSSTKDKVFDPRGGIPAVHRGPLHLSALLFLFLCYHGERSRGASLQVCISSFFFGSSVLTALLSFIFIAERK